MEATDSQYDQLYKIVLIGDSGVGKSSLVSRYVKGTFPKNKGATIGVEFASKNLKLKTGTNVKAQIWDTAGQERYLAITSAHYRRAVGALVVYDICKRQSFDNCEKWINDVKAQADPDIAIMLVGNKLDKAKGSDARDVEEKAGEEFARKHGLLFSEASALSDTNVTSAFEDLLTYIDEGRSKTSKGGKRVVGTSLGQDIHSSFEKDDSGCSC
ncbi:unnamed protein product [Moneuplotes crassus]|uniref:Uncharacterized protein n=2 Tax=Euplotes crassus TaxID=5936 RepID=A0AAD2D597_EUPCR|nr:unnamed protein product [Moneuplotes crassus]CAI2380302.1 unnamed protein product [Moneuplotes crassus]